MTIGIPSGGVRYPTRTRRPVALGGARGGDVLGREPGSGAGSVSLDSAVALQGRGGGGRRLGVHSPSDLWW